MLNPFLRKILHLHVKPSFIEKPLEMYVYSIIPVCTFIHFRIKA